MAEMDGNVYERYSTITNQAPPVCGSYISINVFSGLAGQSAHPGSFLEIRNDVKWVLQTLNIWKIPIVFVSCENGTLVSFNARFLKGYRT